MTPHTRFDHQPLYNDLQPCRHLQVTCDKCQQCTWAHQVNLREGGGGGGEKNGKEVTCPPGLPSAVWPARGLRPGETRGIVYSVMYSVVLPGGGASVTAAQRKALGLRAVPIQLQVPGIAEDLLPTASCTLPTHMMSLLPPCTPCLNSQPRFCSRLSASQKLLTGRVILCFSNPPELSSISSSSKYRASLHTCFPPSPVPCLHTR